MRRRHVDIEKREEKVREREREEQEFQKRLWYLDQRTSEDILILDFLLHKQNLFLLLVIGVCFSST